MPGVRAGRPAGFRPLRAKATAGRWRLPLLRRYLVREMIPLATMMRWIWLVPS